MNREPTGIDGLDPLINGGLPKGSLILLAGNPGSGKSIFSAQFLYRGVVDHNENGVYVSFAESRDTFFSNMHGFDFNFEELERTGKFRFMDMNTMREEELSILLETILDEVRMLKAERLVIDSISAMTQAFKDKIDARIILHTILGKITRMEGCTTLILGEVPFGTTGIGTGIEEFVADGVFLLQKKEVAEGRSARSMELLKLRGTRLDRTRYFYTLDRGFRVIQPADTQNATAAIRSKCAPIPDRDHLLSTGTEDLDRLLHGGLPEGSLVVIRYGENVSTPHRYSILVSMAVNFLAQGRGVITVNSMGADSRLPEILLEGLSNLGADRSRLKIFEFAPYASESQHTASLSGMDIDADLQIIQRSGEALRRAGGPVLRIFYLGSIETIYGPQSYRKVLNALAGSMKISGVTVLIIGPELEYLAKAVSSIANVALDMILRDGTLLLYGNKPSTGLFAVDADDSKGCPKTRLVPLV